MGSAAPYTLLAITIICFVIGLASIAFGCYSDAWWVIDSSVLKRKVGLWRVCLKNGVEEEICSKRADLFEFESNKDAAKDTILIILVAAAVFGFLGLCSILLLFCYRRRRGSWKCAAAVSATLASVGALAGFGALAYSEFEYDQEWDSQDHGWSVLLAWIGSSALLLAAVMSFLLVCILPTKGHHSQTVHYVGNTNQSYQGDFQMR